MQRLVYSPKAFVYVKNSQGQVMDLSRYVASGSVSRKINQVSTAEITLRNPSMIFTVKPTRQHQVFTPMDPISIWLMRVKGRPIRVFTGFLDVVPYYEMYPGTITLTASCTLKKLLYTFFDPALPYTRDFMRSYGWEPSLDGNGLMNLSSIVAQQLPDDKKDPRVKLTDGSIGNLLYATLKDIGGWASSNVFIEELPADLVSRMVTLFKKIDESNTEAKKEWDGFMHDLIGSAALGLGGGNSGGGGGTGPAGAGERVTASWYSAARGAPGSCGGGVWSNNGFTFAELGNGKALGGLPCGARIRVTFHNKSVEVVKQDVGVGGPGVGGTTRAIDLFEPAAAALGIKSAGVGIVKWEHVKKSSDVTHGEMVPAEVHGVIATKVHPKKGGNTKPADSSSDSKWVYPLGHKATIIATPEDHARRAFGNWMSDNAVDLATHFGEPSLAVEDGTIARISGSWSGGSGNPDGFTVYLNGKSGNQYAYMHHVRPYVKAGQHVKQGDELGKTGKANNVVHLHFATKPPLDPREVLKQGRITKGSGAPGGGGGGGGTGASLQDMYSVSKATAFATQLEWPSMEDTIEAVGLQGQKSMMNDKPLMPFIQQLTDASLRQFQSLPNGDFFAFYPDYFGEFKHRKPYWMIDDIEILEGKVQLTDDSLATHVYVVGETLPGGGDYLNKLWSAGVMTINNVFGTEGILNRDEQGKSAPLQDKESAIQFLQRYGARPVLQEEPFIRSPYFEAFMAYQQFMLMWSRQFLTTFTFTFMPELYPGGQVGFPDHGLQMYIDEVQHRWSYTDGFTTDANLSAPSTMGQSATLPPNMVQALNS